MLQENESDNPNGFSEELRAGRTVFMEISTIRILILDDDPFIRGLLSRMLFRLKYTRVTAAESGKKALEIVDLPVGAPDLILCDLNMPEMDGVAFVRKLVDRNYKGSLILISGVEDRVLETAERVVLAHGIRFLGRLQKPFDHRALEKLIGKWTPSVNGVIKKSISKIYSPDEVRSGIENRELILYYQPKVELITGRPVGVEALVRWQHPKDGMAFPDQFISVAEENDLMDELTRLVLTEALGQARQWNDQGLFLKMSVNVSMDNLKSLDFPDFVAGQTAAAGLAPEQLILEVTETRLMQNSLSSLEILTRLRLKGFSLSIDDFGTGNSTFSQLRDIPFTELKVDRGFVHGACCGNPTLMAIYYASLDLARQLGMDLVAEGVEDRDDWDFLRQTGCRMAQGYFIARPMPAENLAGWLRQWNLQRQDLGD